MLVAYWGHAGPSFLTAFLASAVEFVEALTVVLATGTVRGWRDVLVGAAAALLLLALLVPVIGEAVKDVPVGAVRLVVGAFLLLFGMRWLRKAVLRAGGVIPLRDESSAYTRQSEAMRGNVTASGWDAAGFGAAFQVTMLEGIEVVFVVSAIGIGGSGLVAPAAAGAVSALVLVALVGLVLHRPLTRVPENSLKFAVGVLLSSFGCLWFGEGAGIRWPDADWSILGLVAGFLGAACSAVLVCRARGPRPRGLDMLV